MKNKPTRKEYTALQIQYGLRDKDGNPAGVFGNWGPIKREGEWPIVHPFEERDWMGDFEE